MKSPLILLSILFVVAGFSQADAANTQLACMYRISGLNSALNVRAQPGTQHEIIGTIPAGATDVLHLKETVTSQSRPAHRVKLGRTTWLYIKYGNLKGWASASYLAEDECGWTDNWERFGTMRRADVTCTNAEVFMKYNAKSTSLSRSRCLARAKKTLLDGGFQLGNVSRSTAVGSNDEGYKASIWCTNYNLAFFIVVGPEFGTAQNLEAALRRRF